MSYTSHMKNKITIYLNDKTLSKINDARGEAVKISTVINKVFDVLDVQSIESWIGIRR